MNAVGSLPLIENDSIAYSIYRRSATRVNVPGYEPVEHSRVTHV